MIIYAIIRRNSGKAYVGATTRPLMCRMRGHRHNASKPHLHKKNGHIARAIHVHGWAAFDVVELEACVSLSDLNASERRWISKLNSMWPHGYNVRHGGRDGALAETTKAAIAKKAKGRKLSPSVKARAIEMLALHRGKADMRGERNGRAKLLPSDVVAIRAAWLKGGTTQQALADEYGVTQMSITKIVNRINWKHIP